MKVKVIEKREMTRDRIDGTVWVLRKRYSPRVGRMLNIQPILPEFEDLYHHVLADDNYEFIQVDWEDDIEEKREEFLKEYGREDLEARLPMNNRRLPKRGKEKSDK